MTVESITKTPLLESFHLANRRSFGQASIDKSRQEAARRLEVDKFSAIDNFDTEAWRVFNLKNIEKESFDLGDPASGIPHQDLLSQIDLEQEETLRVVVVNGGVNLKLSKIPKGRGVALKLLSELSESEQQELFTTYQSRLDQAFGSDPFVTLNTASFEQTFVLEIEKGTSIESPIHVVYLTDMAAKPQKSGQSKENNSDQDLRATMMVAPKGTISHPRLLISLKENAEATLVEEWMSTSHKSFINGVTLVTLSDSSRLHHVRVQRMALDAYHVDRLLVDVDRSAFYHQVSYTTGAKQSRTDLQVLMKGKGGEAHIEGVAVLLEDQEGDTHSEIFNATAHVASDQLHKIVAGGQAHGVFHGSIRVEPGAQQIKAYQLNRNLLLSDKARVDTKPQLEIFADEVECSHGSATGQLDEDQEFYLESRGLDKEEARATLTFAFAAEVIESIKIDSLKERLMKEAYERIADVS